MRLRAHANRAACAALAIERLLYAVNCLRSESRANVSHGSVVPIGAME
jgi:hypothetical protein